MLELDTHWTLSDMLDAHMVLDMIEDMEAQAAIEANTKATG